jgi:hypothetical protein
MFTLFILFFCFCFAKAKENKKGKCNDQDLKIFQARGSEFPIRFRQYGGFFVTKSSYISALQQNEGLSLSCASCYGDAYICGFENCKMSCVSWGKLCERCLTQYGCKRACDVCTGFL